MHTMELSLQSLVLHVGILLECNIIYESSYLSYTVDH
jgi:hypothetical protein